MAPRNLEWENHNSLRNYPLREGMSLLSADGVFQLPTDALLDLVAFTPKSGDDDFYLSAIEIEEDLGVILKISGVTTGNQIGLFTIPSDFEPSQSFDFVGAGLGSTGKLVVGPGISFVQQWGVGEVAFTADEAAVESSALLALDVGVVTSVGIENNERVLVGDVVLKLGRAMEGEVDLLENSVQISAIKRIEDCEEERAGCPIQSINNIRPDNFGNVVLTAEGIFTLSRGSFGDIPAPGIAVSTIINSPEQQCPTQFELALRGPDGIDGGAGPGGGGGINMQCAGGICCDCEVCDTCEACDCAQVLVAIGIGGNPGGPGAGPGPGPGGGAAVEGAPTKIYGSGLLYAQGKPNALAVAWCKVDGTVLCSNITNLQPGCFDTVVPVGLTTPPSPDNKYKVRLKTLIGFSNPFIMCVQAAGGPTPVKIESFDAIGPWVEIRAPFFLTIDNVNQFEGAGAFAVNNILPFTGVVNNANLSGIGAAPWDFSNWTNVGLYYAKEFDPGEGGPADFVELHLTDNTFTTDIFQLPVPPGNRYPAPHALNPGSFQQVQFNITGATIDLTNVIDVGVFTLDFGTAIPLNCWYDCMDGIP